MPLCLNKKKKILCNQYRVFLIMNVKNSRISSFTSKKKKEPLKVYRNKEKRERLIFGNKVTLHGGCREWSCDTYHFNCE